MPLISPCRVHCRLAAFYFRKPQIAKAEWAQSLKGTTRCFCTNNHQLRWLLAAVLCRVKIIFKYILVRIRGFQFLVLCLEFYCQICSSIVWFLYFLCVQFDCCLPVLNPQPFSTVSFCSSVSQPHPSVPASPVTAAAISPSLDRFVSSCA